jgi:O-antigen/teichoic acid export membrane protein
MATPRTLVRNSLLNILGEALPAVVSLLVIPLLISRLGLERFGVLTLSWTLIGYFSLFDLGLGRALTSAVAERLASGQGETSGPIILNALALMFGLGLVGSAAVILPARWFVDSVLEISAALRPEVIAAFGVIAAGIPVVTTMAGLRGVLEAHQRFGTVNAVRIPMGILQFVGPLVALQFTTNVAWLTASLLIARLLGWIVLLIVVRPLIPRPGGVHPSVALPLLRTGSWMTVSQVIGPLMVTLDRFIVAAVVSAAALAHYATPNDMVSKFGLISNAIAAVIFPAFASLYRTSPGQAVALFLRSLRWLVIALFPATLLVILWSAEGLALWIDADFAAHATIVLQVLIVGVFFNGLAKVPFSLLHAANRADIPAKFHALQLPLFIAVLYLMSGAFGIAGAAVAFTLRMIADTIVLFAASERLMPIGRRRLLTLGTASLAGLLLFAGAATVEDPIHKAVLTVMFLAVFSIAGWKRLLAQDERAGILRLLRVRRTTP